MFIPAAELRGIQIKQFRDSTYIQGVSTKIIKEIVSCLGIEDLSASSISRISKELDEKVEEFLRKPIAIGH